MSVILFPNAVTVVLSRLRAALPAVIFVHDLPATRPSAFVRLLRTGGPRTNLVVDGAQLTIEAWGPTSDAAATTAELVRAHLNSLPDQVGVVPPIYRIDELSGPAELPDPVSSSRRYTWSVIVHLRGAE